MPYVKGSNCLNNSEQMPHDVGDTLVLPLTLVEIVENAKALRLLAGYTLAEAASITGLSQQCLNHYEQGYRLPDNVVRFHVYLNWLTHVAQRGLPLLECRPDSLSPRELQGSKLFKPGSFVELNSEATADITKAPFQKRKGGVAK
jgi:transcriptional regulator with XRE-family HTH domain